MLRIMLITLGFTLLLIIAVMGYCCCVIAGRENETMERLYEKEIGLHPSKDMDTHTDGVTIQTKPCED